MCPRVHPFVNPFPVIFLPLFSERAGLYKSNLGYKANFNAKKSMHMFVNVDVHTCINAIDINGTS